MKVGLCLCARVDFCSFGDSNVHYFSNKYDMRSYFSQKDKVTHKNSKSSESLVDLATFGKRFFQIGSLACVFLIDQFLLGMSQSILVDLFSNTVALFEQYLDDVIPQMILNVSFVTFCLS